MSALQGKINRIVKAAGLDQGAYYQHFGASSAPIYLQRAVYQLAYAGELAKTEGGKLTEIVENAADALLRDLAENGAFTKKSALEAENILMPLADRAKAYTVHMVAHAHIDMNWMWPYHETVAVVLETFRTMLKLMDEYPDFTYAQSQASTYRIVELHDPDMLEQIKRRVREGRWEVSASTWVEADKNMPNEESMARHLLYTKNYLAKLLDIDPATLNLDYEPDTFGHSANVPEILAQGGVKYYYHCRGNDSDAIYRWRGQSGAEVLVFCEPTWYLGDANPNFALYVPSFCASHGIRDYIKVYGVGDHGGGPTRQDLSFIEQMRTWPVFPKIEYSSYRAYYAALEQARDQFPVVQRELNCVFTGCYTTQCRVKASNRIGEATLTEAETLAAGAKLLLGKPYRAEAFEEGWRNVLFNQFHDILTGSGVRDTREYALSIFSQTMAQAGTKYADAMRAVAGAIDTSSVTEQGATEFTKSEGAGVGFGSMRFRPPVAERGLALTRVFTVFNPADHERAENVELTVWDYPGAAARMTARDLAGNPLPIQHISRGTEGYMGHNYLRAVVGVKVPAFGWTTVVLDESPDEDVLFTYPGDPRTHTADEYALENEYLRAEFDVQNGSVARLLDKVSGKELLGAPAGFFEIDEDTDKGMTSWVVGRYLRRERVAGDVRIRRVSDGPLRKSIELKTKFGRMGSELTCLISLDAGARALVFDVACDWKEVGTRETCIPQLAFAAPVGYEFAEARYDIPAGMIDRAPTGLDVPTNGLAAALPCRGDETLLLTSDTKYGFRAADGALQVTLIRASYDPDPYPERGLHNFRIALCAMENADPVSLKRAAQDAARPLPAIADRPHEGTLAGTGSFLAAEGARVSALKVSEDGKALIVRLVNYEGAKRASLSFAAPVGNAYLSNVLEQPLEKLDISEGRATLRLPAKSLTTVRVEL